MSSLAAVSGIVPLAPGVLPGLVFAFRIHADGCAEPRPVDERIDLAPVDGEWLWLHFNLTDQRACHWLATAPLLPAAQALLLGLHDHQKLYAAAD